MRSIIIVILSFISLVSCKTDTKELVAVTENEPVAVQRFDRLFYQKSPEEIQELKKTFPYFFPAQVHDSVWFNKSNNKEEIALQQDAEKVFGDFKTEEKQLGHLFKNVKKYFPQFKSPKVITLISDIDYESKVIYADSLLLISLDMYLGKDHEIYKEFPTYLSQRYDKAMLAVDVASAIAEQTFQSRGRNNFLNQMINQGKNKCLVDAFLPDVSDALKMGYTEEQLEWAQQNEFLIWQYFMENKLLYSYDIDLLHRFVFEAPFSKFYLESDQESPGRIGVYIGWQIVKAYQENNDVSITELLKTEPEIIFEKSKFKPRK